MALDSSHPNLVVFEGALHLTTLSKGDAEAAIHRHQAWHKAWARVQRVHSRIVASGALIGGSTTIVIGVLALRLHAFEQFLLLVPIGMLVGAIAGAAVNRVIEPPPYAAPPPMHGVARAVAENAAPDASPADIRRWTQQILSYESALAQLPIARASVARKDYENYISPGDRSTWHYSPEHLAQLETDFERRRRDYEAAAAALGFSPDPSPADLSDSPPKESPPKESPPN
jgi:hypothetical protein